jgi:hypothetical protein
LIKIWKENFSEKSLIDFSMDQCPMLIGIVRQISMENNSLIKYQSEILLMNDVLVLTNEEFDPEILLYQLIIFKQEFDKNERYLVNICHILIHISITDIILVIRFRSKNCRLSGTGY